jgi:hypothetical protein
MDHDNSNKLFDRALKLIPALYAHASLSEQNRFLLIMLTDAYLLMLMATGL